MPNEEMSHQKKEETKIRYITANDFFHYLVFPQLDH